VTAARVRRRVVRRIALALLGFGLCLPAALTLSPATPPASGQPDNPEFLQIRIDSISPDVVTTSSEPIVNVTAAVINVGDRPVRDILARLEHAPAVDTAAGLGGSLGNGVAGFEPATEFTSVAAELGRGQAAELRFVVPIRPGRPSSLNIEAPGVYPLLINVNGTPDYGSPARLDQRRFLLPVTGVPAGTGSGNPLADVIAPDTTKPVGVTMLWPLADKPRLAPGVPGGTTPVRLMNDDLAVSLAPGGRLDTLLAAAESATSPGALDPGGGINRALCLAVDPDLLITVNAMTAGYVVADDPDGLGVASHPGTGRAVATAWLDRLRNAARRLCVTPTPYAQADLGALHRVDSPVLSAAATLSGADIVDQILGITSTRGVTVLGDSPLTDEALALLDRQGGTVVLAAGDDPEPRRLSERVTLAPFEPAVGGALAAVGTDPAVPGYLDLPAATALNRESAVARRQNAVGAILWQLLAPDATPRTQLLVPPAKWSPQPEDAQLILTTLANSFRAGLAAARPLSAVVAASVAAPPGNEPTLLPDADHPRFDDDVTSDISGQFTRLQDLGSALTTDTRTGLTGPQYTAPLREDMLRALSQIEPAQVRNDVARRRLNVVGRTIADLFGAVTIVNPGDSYTLATERSALPLALRNELAVPIRVRLQVDAPPGMAVTDIGEQELPPGYLPLRVPVEVHITQRVAVDVTLRTPAGTQLGEPVRLSVHSNAYGKVLFAITITGAVMLVLLVGRRLYHRFRGQPDRADLDRPDDRHRYDDLAQR